ncbi:MAG: ATP--guanido phosphotransferase [candidate division FCPU426 bacterium]
MSVKSWPLPLWVKPHAGNPAVLSTRIRLARNLKGYKFPLTADSVEKEKLVGAVGGFLEKQPGMTFLRLQREDALRRGVLAERGLIHMDSASKPDDIGLGLAQGQSLSYLLNEEDHVRIQVMKPGLDLEGGLRLARVLDEKLGKAFPFARHAQFGYLTACPTNVGTGLRASAMLHLPALALTRGIVQVLQAVVHMGLAVRGFYGEGTELKTVFFQISNQITLGRTEEEIITQLSGVIRQVVERETEARQKLLKSERRLLEDKVGRAVGILRHCRLLGLEEALDLLSSLRLGVETRLLRSLSPAALNELLLQVQPAHLQQGGEKTLSAEEQQSRRASLIRKRLKLDAGRG